MTGSLRQIWMLPAGLTKVLRFFIEGQRSGNFIE